MHVWLGACVICVYGYMCVWMYLLYINIKYKYIILKDGENAPSLSQYGAGGCVSGVEVWRRGELWLPLEHLNTTCVYYSVDPRPNHL